MGKKRKDPWKIIDVHSGTCSSAPLCSVTTVSYANGDTETSVIEIGPDGSSYTETLKDRDWNVVWDYSVERDENGRIVHEEHNGEPAEFEREEQPLPDGANEPSRRNCFGLPTSRDECPTEVAPEQEVSQPGHGDEGGAAGGFDPGIQERVDVVTQPSPTGTGLAGGAAGGGPSDPGSGGACTTCDELAPQG